MRYGLVATNPIERVALATGLVPTPLIDTWETEWYIARAMP